MVAVCLYFGFCRNHKGGHKPDEIVKPKTYPGYDPNHLYTVCGGVYYNYCTTDVSASCISKDVVVSIAPPGHHCVLFSQKNPVNYTTKECTEKNQIR